MQTREEIEEDRERAHRDLTSIEKLHEQTHDSFWSRMTIVDKRIGKPITDVVLNIQTCQITEKEALIEAEKAGNFMRDLLILAMQVRRLYWEADYHGIDSSGNSCGCRFSTHEKRTYPSLMRRLEKVEKELVQLQGKQ